MPEFDDDDQFDETSASPAMKQLREAFKRSEKDRKAQDAVIAELQVKAAKADTLERENVFVKAGVPSEGLGSYFLKGYEGELTTEAVKAAWDAVAPSNGTTPVPGQPDPQQQRLQNEATSADRMSAASQGATNPDRDTAFTMERLQAKTPQELIAVLAKYDMLPHVQG